MDGFFSPQLLDLTRLLVLQGERVANPDFYPMLRSFGLNNLPDQSTMAAISFCDVVVSHELHELVHVEQHRQLGIPRFADLYVRGFLSGGSYEAIPLEVNAYTLEDHFRSDPRRGFSVQQKLRHGWQRGGCYDEESNLDPSVRVGEYEIREGGVCPSVLPAEGLFCDLGSRV